MLPADECMRNTGVHSPTAYAKRRVMHAERCHCVQKGTTWLKQFLSELINVNASAPPECNDLVVPVTVSTQQDAVDLRCVCTNAAMPLAINIPVPMLTPEQTHAVSASLRDLLVKIPERGNCAT